MARFNFIGGGSASYNINAPRVDPLQQRLLAAQVANLEGEPRREAEVMRHNQAIESGGATERSLTQRGQDITQRGQDLTSQYENERTKLGQDQLHQALQIHHETIGAGLTETLMHTIANYGLPPEQIPGILAEVLKSRGLPELSNAMMSEESQAAEHGRTVLAPFKPGSDDYKTAMAALPASTQRALLKAPSGGTSGATPTHPSYEFTRAEGPVQPGAQLPGYITTTTPNASISVANPANATSNGDQYGEDPQFAAVNALLAQQAVEKRMQDERKQREKVVSARSSELLKRQYQTGTLPTSGFRYPAF